jgi:hypothetical protein
MRKCPGRATEEDGRAKQTSLDGGHDPISIQLQFGFQSLVTRANSAATVFTLDAASGLHRDARFQPCIAANNY